jgi:dihydrofolate reductase
MRTITFGGAVSLDGFLAGPNGELDWLHFSSDVQQIMSDYWKSVDTILMGRKTFAAAAAQHPPRKKGGKPRRAQRPTVSTYVFSRSLESLDHPGAELIRDNAAEFVDQLKHSPGREICLMGGGELAQSLFAAGLVDKVGLNVHPVMLGSGVPVFRDPGHRVHLHLTGCRSLDGGCVFTTYDVRRAS